MIINPHALPSRMTIGQFLDTMGGKAAEHIGAFMDGTPFSTQNRVYDTKEMLLQLGYHGYSNEFLYNGQNGELIESEILLFVYLPL
jgi:DNA-directed RNA polymerase beta subunit